MQRAVHGILLLASGLATGWINNANGATDTTVWVEDALPVGAGGVATGGDSWNWISGGPTPFSGTKAHQSSIGAGLHEHFFNWASATLTVAAGDTLFAYVYLDPANLPRELMLCWNANNWEHRAYWGANLINYGADNSAGRHYMGPLPAAGQWVRLEVPASQVGLEGQTCIGMGFSLYGGRATWDYAGSSNQSSNPGIGTNSPPVGTNSPPIGTNTPPTGTNASPADTNSTSAIRNFPPLALPKVDDTALRILSPTLLEVNCINSKAPEGDILMP